MLYCLRTNIKGISLHPRKAVTINFSAHNFIVGKESLGVSIALFMYWFAFLFNFRLLILIPELDFYRQIVHIQVVTSRAPLVVLSDTSCCLSLATTK